MFNANAVNVAPNRNNEYFWNDDNTIRCRVQVQPGLMKLKLERQAGELEFPTRHGHTLEQVEALATKLVTSQDLKTARRVFRKMA